MDRVFSCVDLRDSNVIFAPPFLEGQKFRRPSVDVQRICTGVPSLRNSIHNFRPSTCQSLLTKQLKEIYLVTFRKSLYIYPVSLKSNKELGKRTISIAMPVCLFVLSCVSMKQLFCHWMGFL